MGRAIGIDLGTCYSCVAVLQHGQIEIIPNDHGNRTTPSYVAFTDTERLIGDAAKNQTAMNPGNTVYDVKRMIGRNFEDDEVQGDMQRWPFRVENYGGRPEIEVEYKGETRSFFAEEISAMVLSKMKETAETYIGEKVKDAVITVPAYFNYSQRQATKDAAMIAGLNVLRIINEPTAAAIAYGLHKKNKEEKTVLIFDIGGGTLDVSVLNIEEDVFQVRSTSGNTHLGGEDFNNRMVDFCIRKMISMNDPPETLKKIMEKVKNTHRPSQLENAIMHEWRAVFLKHKRAAKRLSNACEQAKRTLSAGTRAQIDLDSLYEGFDFTIGISRAKFEELNADYFSATLAPVQQALRDAKLDKQQIDEVIMVGGSTRIPMIQKLVKNYFGGKELNKSINPDEAIAYGAAVQAALLNWGQTVDLEDILLIDVAPLSIGIETSGGIMTPIIPRNSTIPTKKTDICTTYRDNQSSVLIRIYQGERPLAKDNNRLCKFDLDGIAPAPRGVPQIEVTYNIDADGILTVAAIDTASKIKKEITITNENGRLSQQEIEKMVNDAEKFKEEDEELKECMSARNELESFVDGVKETLEVYKLSDTITVEEKAKLLEECNSTIVTLDTNMQFDKAIIDDLRISLETRWTPILTRLELPGASPSYASIGNLYPQVALQSRSPHGHSTYLPPK